MNYQSAGVDISKGERLVDRIKALMGADGSRIGHFGGAIPIPTGDYKEPLLVSSIDGVGTKIKVASALGKNSGSGRDMLHHSVNDIAVCGAEPIGFLDYIAMSKLNEAVVEDVVGGIVSACKKLNIPLLGGEIAEMPGVYQEEEYDLVGAIFGIVEKSEYIRGDTIEAGDLLIGFPSVGLHTNGFSLARKIVDLLPNGYSTLVTGTDITVGEALLTEHKCYLEEIRGLKKMGVKGLAHITGGGIPGNLPRIIPNGLITEVDWDAWEVPLLFRFLQKSGDVSDVDMRSAFNMGIGLVAVLTKESINLIDLSGTDLKGSVIGKVISK
ncbi:phosphoribosylformylglycinamidine cyclo-ligase [Calditrichota bacterium]